MHGGAILSNPLTGFYGRKNSGCSKDGSGLPIPQNSAEHSVFCREVLQNASHSKKLVEERFCRTPKVLQNFGSQAQFFRPCQFFAHFRDIQRSFDGLDGVHTKESCKSF